MYIYVHKHTICTHLVLPQRQLIFGTEYVCTFTCAFYSRKENNDNPYITVQRFLHVHDELAREHSIVWIYLST